MNGHLRFGYNEYGRYTEVDAGPLPAGVHTVDVRVISGDPGSAAANVSSALAPQLQGVLTATIVRR